VEVAREIRKSLENNGLKCDMNGNALREFYVTDSPEKFLFVGERFLERKIEHIGLIKDISAY
jgi:hypothetical protein